MKGFGSYYFGKTENIAPGGSKESLFPLFRNISRCGDAWQQISENPKYCVQATNGSDASLWPQRALSDWANGQSGQYNALAFILTCEAITGHRRVAIDIKMSTGRRPGVGCFPSQITDWCPTRMIKTIRYTRWFYGLRSRGSWVRSPPAAPDDHFLTCHSVPKPACFLA